MKRNAIILLGILLMIGLVAGQVQARDVKPLVVRDQGRVEIQKAPNQKWRLVSSSRIMVKGGAGRTMEQSIASVHLWSDKVKVTMFENCTFRYTDLVKKGVKYVMAFNQDRGMIKVKVDPSIHKTSGFQLKTPQALLAVQGTQFFVRVGEGDPNSKNLPTLELDYLKKNKDYDVSQNPVTIPVNASVYAIGGAAGAVCEMVAQAAPVGNAGFTLIGVLKGTVSVVPNTGSGVSVNAGQTLIVWDNRTPVFLRVDPEFVKESKPDTHTADVPTMPESGTPTGGVPAGALNPSGHPSGTDSHGWSHPGSPSNTHSSY